MIAPWSLVTFVDAADDTGVAAQLRDGRVIAVDHLAGLTGVLDVVREWDRFAPILRSWQPESGPELEYHHLVAPLRFPNKVLCAGANYRAHLAEMGVEPDPAADAFFFFKPPTTTIIGPGETIIVRTADDKPDWEAEVAVVIGRAGRAISADVALEHVAGYTLVNDVSARGPHRVAHPLGPPFAWDWVASKAQDTFLPLGPGVTPTWLVDDPDNIPLALSVNGVTKQASSTSDLLFGIADLISAASKWTTLEPGDVIATGTPAGVGLPRGEFLTDGDVVEVTSPILGVLANPVRVLAGSDEPDAKAPA